MAATPALEAHPALPAVPFWKLSGSGNDFVALREPAAAPAPEEIRAWCRRGVSLGADGLIALRRGAAGQGVEMDYWNADGHPADLCLNGTRCAARLAFELGWGEESLSIRTAAGTYAARELPGSRIELTLPFPAEPPRALDLAVEGVRHRAWFLTVGVPHLVLLWPESLARAPVVALGAPLRAHPDLGPAGANVDFVRFPGRRRMEIRTFERGVEGETLSCGTGVLAAAAVGLHLGLAELPVTVATQGGFELEVGGDRGSGRFTLAGDARIVARGELLAEAGALPAPPPWAAR
ncbi:MAG TPA: diaminopimelate epimerase [Thermoanaerobaculia bacterium]|nr:diaminopimelate epimerase [Thermoanaerobaculia bacterium]